MGYIEDLLEIYHQGFISYHQLYSANMYNLTFQYLTKAAFSCLQTIKVTFFILHHFPVVSPRCVSPFFLPIVSPQCVSPFLGRSPRASLSAFQDLSGIFHQSMKLKEPLNSINLGRVTGAFRSAVNEGDLGNLIL